MFPAMEWQTAAGDLLTAFNPAQQADNNQRCHLELFQRRKKSGMPDFRPFTQDRTFQFISKIKKKKKKHLMLGV